MVFAWVVVVLFLLMAVGIAALEISVRNDKKSYLNYVHALLIQKYGNDFVIITNKVTYNESETRFVSGGNMYSLKTKDREVTEEKVIMESTQLEAVAK